MASAYQDRRCKDPSPGLPTARRSARPESRPAARTPAPAAQPAHTLRGTSPPGSESQPRSASGNPPPRRCPPTHRWSPPRTSCRPRTAHRPPRPARTRALSLPENPLRKPRHPRPWQCRPDPMSSSQTAAEASLESAAHPLTRLQPRSSPRRESAAHRPTFPLQCPCLRYEEDSSPDRPPDADR